MTLGIKTRPTVIKVHTGLDKPIEDFEYLIHHIELDAAGKEELHHCFMFDHLGNMFEQKHMVVKDGKIYVDGKEIKEGVFHIIAGLEPSQEVLWSDEEARHSGVDQKPMVAGMTKKQKSAVW